MKKLNDLFARLRAVPGVEAVGGANALPLASDFMANGTFLVLNPGQIPTRMEDFERLMHDPSITGYADYCVASEDYFRVLAIPLLRGRLFEDRDVMDAPHVAVINNALARTRWPGKIPSASESRSVIRKKRKAGERSLVWSETLATAAWKLFRVPRFT